MSSLRKFFSFAVVLAMVLGIMAPAFAAPVPQDAVGTDYEVAARRLAAFDIMVGDEYGSFQGAREITRAEMTKIIVAMQGMSEAAALAQGATPFEDVPATHWASGYINVAYTAGMVKGTSETTFEPDRKVTYQEAITMIVRACGYVALPGVWPVNYVNKASQIGITKGLQISGSATAVRGMIARLVNNALDAKPMKVSKVDAAGNPLEYEQEDTTVLAKYFELTEVTGIVLFTYKEDVELDEGEVTILVGDVEETYTLGNYDMTEYLGREIVFYIDDEEAEAPVIEGVKQVKTSKDKIIAPKEFGEVKYASSKYTIEYVKSNDDAASQTAATVYCVLNGRKYELPKSNNTKLTDPHGYGVEYMQEATGTIIKHKVDKEDRLYLIVETWTQPYIVTDVTATSKKEQLVIESMDEAKTETLNLYDNTNDEVEYVITLDGEVVDIDEIEEDDVVEVLASLCNASERRYEIRVTRDAVSGTVDTISYRSSGIESRLKIDGTYYDVNEELDIKDVARGDEVTALLDANGEIVRVFRDGGKSTASGKYAVVMEVEEQTFGSFGSMKDPARVQLLLADGTKKIFKAVDNLRVYTNGVVSTYLINDGYTEDHKFYYKSGKDWLLSESNPENLDAELAAFPLVKYETNSDGLLSRVNVLDYPDNDDYKAANNVDYKEGSTRWGGYLMTKDTVIFNVDVADGDPAKTFKYTDLDTISGVDSVVVKVANTKYNEVEVVYITNKPLDVASSDIKVAMVLTKDELDDDIYELGLDDGTRRFTLQNDEDCNDVSNIYPLDLVVYTVNGSDEITDMDVIDDMLDDNIERLQKKEIISSINVSRGYISVSDDAYTEYVGTSPAVFDVSDYTGHVYVKPSLREVRTISLGDLETDMKVTIYRVEIDKEDYYYIVVTDVDVDTK